MTPSTSQNSATLSQIGLILLFKITYVSRLQLELLLIWVLQKHSYFVFTKQDENKSASQHTKDIKTSISDSLAAASANQRGNLVVDEWSGALTRQSLSNEPDEVAARRDFCTAQLEAYSNYTAGWSFWAYKKEDCDEDLDWCFTAAVGRVLPSDFPSYPRNCHPPSSTGGLLDPRSHIDGLFLPPPSTAKQTTSRDRLAAIHYRRWRRDTANTTAKEQSSTQGYSDGFSTARFFYQCDGSRLGFRGQYIEDSIAALGPDVITPGTESDYSEGFNHGLSDGEACGS